MAANLELSVRFTSDEKDPASAIQVSLFRPDTGVSTPPAPFTPIRIKVNQIAYPQ